MSQYGETVSRKIILMMAWFNLLSLFLNGRRVPLETSDKIGSKTSPSADAIVWQFLSHLSRKEDPAVSSTRPPSMF
jgi:hypothetical protein